jgi:3-deoxy-D-manno-octulosonic-acid transferase
MGILLDAGYLAAGLLASPWLAFKAATDARYRHRLGERLGFIPASGRTPVLWIHGASVGEISLVRPLLKKLARDHPGLSFHVTTLTRAARENAEQSFPDAQVAYFPFDLSGSVGRSLRRVQPKGVVLIELEVWPNFVRECTRRGVPVAVINGRMSERSFARYRKLRWFFRPVFRRLAAVGAQSEAHAERLRAMGATPVVTGNLKFDAALSFDPVQEEREWRERLSLGDAPVLVAGSTHDPEERILVETYKRLQATFPRLRFIVAPRHLERVAEVQKVIEAAELKCYKKSQLSPGASPDGVVLLDTVGELARVYSVATAVFIGGTFSPRGGQNMLEPAALGKPIVSGPSVSNFEEISRTLVEAGGMKILDNPIELALALGELLRNPAAAREAGERAEGAVRAGRGALGATANLIEQHLLKGS